MPCVCSLKIWSCPKLKTLPDYLLQSTTLEKLYITGCPILRRHYRVEEAENWVKDSSIPKIRIYENPMSSDDLESSSPSVVSFHDNVEDELPETQTETARISAIHRYIFWINFFIYFFSYTFEINIILDNIFQFW